MLTGKLPKSTRAMKPPKPRPFCPRPSPRTVLSLGLALAILVHLAANLDLPVPSLPAAPRSPTSEDLEEESLGIISRARARERASPPSPASRNATAASRPDAPQAAAAPCLPMIFYDKPMKTGSTAVTSALDVLLTRHNQTSLVCKLAACGLYAERLCASRRPYVHLIDHIAANVSTALCLKRLRYYSVTSIRAPADRWNSAYLFNQQKKSAHYNISYREPYDVFMAHLPNCALLKYYDRGRGECHGGVNTPAFQKRVEDILLRFDEIIDLYGEPLTDLHARLMPFLARENVSKTRSKVPLGTVPKDRLVYEQALYDALVKRRLQLAKVPNQDRVLCKKPHIP